MPIIFRFCLYISLKLHTGPGHYHYLDCWLLYSDDCVSIICLSEFVLFALQSTCCVPAVCTHPSCDQQGGAVVCSSDLLCSHPVWLWTPPVSGSGSRWTASPLQTPEQPAAGTCAAASCSSEAPSGHTGGRVMARTARGEVSQLHRYRQTQEQHRRSWPQVSDWMNFSHVNCSAPSADPQPLIDRIHRTLASPLMLPSVTVTSGFCSVHSTQTARSVQTRHEAGGLQTCTDQPGGMQRLLLLPVHLRNNAECEHCPLLTRVCTVTTKQQTNWM